MTRFWTTFFVVAAFAVGADWVTKQWAIGALVLHRPVALAGEVVRLTLSYNTGVAFGALAGSGVWVALLSGAVLLAMVGWLVRATLAGSLPLSLAAPLGLLLGGGTANLLDRLPDGQVTDFIDVGLGAQRWPTFNIADACIVVAVAALVLLSPKPGPSHAT